MAVQSLTPTRSTKNGYTYGITPLSTVNASTADSIATTALTEDFADKKVLVGIIIDTAYADVVASLTVEGSADGTNWCALATAIADTTPNVTGTYVALADLSSIHVPYYRVICNNTTAVNMGTSGKCKLFYAVR